MRAIDTVRAADSAARSLGLLPSTCAVACDFAERIATHPELRIKTRLHQLPRRVCQERIVDSLDHTRDEERTFLVRHSARRTAFIIAQRSR
jgi:hypothetical protein